MIKGSDVVAMLRPNGGWVTRGNEYEDIEFIECEPITKAQFEAGFEQYDAWKAKQDSIQATAKAELLKRLGITAEEAQLLLA